MLTSTTDILSAVSAIKKNIIQNRKADVRRPTGFDLLGERRPSAIAQGGRGKKGNAAFGGRILENLEKKNRSEFPASRFWEECRQITFIGQPTILAISFWLLAFGIS